MSTTFKSSLGAVIKPPIGTRMRKNNKPASRLIQEAGLTTVLTIDGLGAYGSRGGERFQEQLLWSGKHEIGLEKVRKKFHQQFGS